MRSGKHNCAWESRTALQSALARWKHPCVPGRSRDFPGGRRDVPESTKAFQGVVVRPGKQECVLKRIGALSKRV